MDRSEMDHQAQHNLHEVSVNSMVRPWKATGWENTLVNDAEGYTICACPGCTIGEAKANARLIASAPELLAACEELLQEAIVLSDSCLTAYSNAPAETLIYGWPKDRWMRIATMADKAKRAIDKAKGESCKK